MWRQENDVREDMGETKIESRSKMATDREAWKKIVEQAKTHKEL